MLLGLVPSETCWAAATTVQLPGGTRFMIELAHTITSGRTPVGSPVFFRVAENVTVGDQVVIRKGTVVEGRMQAVGDRGMAATSGTINFGVRHVPAVDGQNVRVLASVSNKGRSRDGAMLGWVFMWGWFGLATRGVDAFALRGAQLEAEVLTDRTIAASPPNPPEPVAMSIRSVEATGVRVGRRKVDEILVSLERATALLPLVLEVPAAGPVTAATLISTNGVDTVEEVAATAVADGRVEFNLWDIVKYCDDGDNTLTLRLTGAGGEPIDATASLRVRLKRKQ
ncbi:MAG: hypothetical protein R3E65_09090 [Steroidobacteraceae bacterium]